MVPIEMSTQYFYSTSTHHRPMLHRLAAIHNATARYFFKQSAKVLKRLVRRKCNTTDFVIKLMMMPLIAGVLRSLVLLSPAASCIVAKRCKNSAMCTGVE